MALENRAIATAGRLKLMASKCDQKTGRLHHHANAPRAGEGDGGGVHGGVRSLLELLDVYTHCYQRKRR